MVDIAQHEAPRLIGLTGCAGAGKDTVADTLERWGFQRYALAQPLKQAVIDMFQLDDDVFSDRARKEALIEDIGASPRHLAQTLGTEWGRRLIADDVWIRVMRRHVELWLAYGQAVVVSDVRFNNEAAAIHELGGVVVRVRAPEVEAEMAWRNASWWRRLLRALGFPIRPKVHASERGVSDELVDEEILNDGSLGRLRTRAINLWCAYKGVPTAEAQGA